MRDLLRHRALKALPFRFTLEAKMHRGNYLFLQSLSPWKPHASPLESIMVPIAVKSEITHSTSSKIGYLRFHLWNVVVNAKGNIFRETVCARIIFGSDWVWEGDSTVGCTREESTKECSL